MSKEVKIAIIGLLSAVLVAVIGILLPWYLNRCDHPEPEPPHFEEPVPDPDGDMTIKFGDYEQHCVGGNCGGTHVEFDEDGRPIIDKGGRPPEEMLEPEPEPEPPPE